MKHIIWGAASIQITNKKMWKSQHFLELLWSGCSFKWNVKPKSLVICVISISTAAQNTGICVQISPMLYRRVGTLSEEALHFLVGNYALWVFSKIPGKGQTFPDIVRSCQPAHFGLYSCESSSYFARMRSNTTLISPNNTIIPSFPNSTLG